MKKRTKKRIGMAISAAVVAIAAYHVYNIRVEDAKAGSEYDNIADAVRISDEPVEAVPIDDEPAADEGGFSFEDDGPKYDIGTYPNLVIDHETLKKANPDYVGWLYVPCLEISYPVVQGKDNEYYLKHLIDGSYNGNGTLFVHCANHFLRDDVSYIFGHHMYGGAMFGNLKKYDSSAYYWNHPEFKLYTPSKTYTLRIYAVFYGTGVEKITFNYSSEASFNAAMKAYAARALHTPQTSVSYGDKLVCLCTCAYQVNNGRYFVLCKVMNP